MPSDLLSFRECLFAGNSEGFFLPHVRLYVFPGFRPGSLQVFEIAEAIDVDSYYASPRGLPSKLAARIYSLLGLENPLTSQQRSPGSIPISISSPPPMKFASTLTDSPGNWINS
jgi:hypothetical protein